jgi:predicted ATPase
MRILEELTVRNFRSIRQQTLKLGRLNVFIGGNGSGKSNLVGVFHFLNQVVQEQLQTYTGMAGGADNILHFSRKRSPSLGIAVSFAEGSYANGYRFELAPTEEDRFIFKDERISFHDRSRGFPRPMDIFLGQGHAESKLPASKERVAGYVRSDLGSYHIYHFHDTSAGAKVKQTGDLEDNRYLREDASNLAAFLYQLQEKHPETFSNIEGTVRQVAPFFDSFHLEPSRLNPDKIRLEWKEKGSDRYFNAHALSDGTLRFICLTTLLLQPVVPPVILLDEPELGLHPAAIELLADLFGSAAERTQVLAATQSVTLVNQLTPEVVWAVDRLEGESVFRHLAKEDLSMWLDGYALGDLWEKNVVGARP